MRESFVHEVSSPVLFATPRGGPWAALRKGRRPLAVGDGLELVLVGLGEALLLLGRVFWRAEQRVQHAAAAVGFVLDFALPRGRWYSPVPVEVSVRAAGLSGADANGRELGRRPRSALSLAVESLPRRGRVDARHAEGHRTVGR